MSLFRFGRKKAVPPPQPVRPKRVAIYGACHAEALRKVLAASPGVGEALELIQIPAFFMMDEKEIDAFTNELLPTLDLFIYQPISEEAKGPRYASANLLRFLRPGARTVRFAYPHIEIYSPFILYAPPDFPAFEYTFVDYGIAWNVLLGRKKEDVTHSYKEPPLDSYAQQIANKNFEELRSREDRTLPNDHPIDVPISDFIERHFKERQLFSSMNHPTAFVLHELARRVVKIADINLTIGPEPATEYLNDVHTPVSQEVARVLGLRGLSDRIVLFNRSMSWEEYVSIQYDYFERIPAAKIEKEIVNLSYARPWFQALLTN